MVKNELLSAFAVAATAGLTGFYLIKEFIKSGYMTGRKAVFWWMAVTAAVTATSFLFEGYGYSFWKKEKYCILLILIMGLGLADQKEHKLPNRFLLLLAVLRIAVLIGEWITWPQLGAEFASHVLTGAAGSFLLMMAAWYISRKAIGLGDVKLLTVTGAYLGFSLNYIMLFLALVLAAAYGVWKMARKKIAVKDSIAFGPFVAVSVWIVLLLGM